MRESALVASVLLTLAGVHAHAQQPKPFEAVVVGVVDGDTLTVEHEGKRFNVCLLGIDAPELDQSYGLRARSQALELAYARTVRVEPAWQDETGRVFARVLVGGSDVALALVRDGAGWYDINNADDPALQQAEAEAKSGRRGLWAGEAPVAPWEFRLAKQEQAARQQAAKPTRVATLSDFAASVKLVRNRGAQTVIEGLPVRPVVVGRSVHQSANEGPAGQQPTTEKPTGPQIIEIKSSEMEEARARANRPLVVHEEGGGGAQSAVAVAAAGRGGAVAAVAVGGPSVAVQRYWHEGLTLTIVFAINTPCKAGSFNYEVAYTLDGKTWTTGGSGSWSNGSVTVSTETVLHERAEVASVRVVSAECNR